MCNLKIAVYSLLVFMYTWSRLFCFISNSGRFSHRSLKRNNLFRLYLLRNSINEANCGHAPRRVSRIYSALLSEFPSYTSNVTNHGQKIEFEGVTINDIDHEIHQCTDKKKKTLMEKNHCEVACDNMDDRISSTKTYSSENFSNKDSRILDMEVKIQREIDGMGKIKDTADINTKDKIPKRNLRMTTSLLEDGKKARIKGYLEINPNVCFGCGSDFQSKDENKPGYLSKLKLKEHFTEAKIIREKQNAINILNLAGIELNSKFTEGILLNSGISTDTIASIKAIGLQSESTYCIERGEEIVGTPNKTIDYKICDDYNNLDEVNVIGPKISGVETCFAEGMLDTSMEGSAIFIEDGKKGIRSKTNVSSHDLDNDKLKDELKHTPLICQRCFKLNQYGQVKESLRPGWSDHELLTPSRFENLLFSIKDTSSVILYIIDLFDLEGSLLPNLKRIVGTNPVVIAGNKIDLLPADVSKHRLKSSVYDAVRAHCGLISPKESGRDIRRGIQEHDGIQQSTCEDGVLRRKNVHLVSCRNGLGIDELLVDLMKLTLSNGNRVRNFAFMTLQMRTNIVFL